MKESEYHDIIIKQVSEFFKTLDPLRSIDRSTIKKCKKCGEKEYVYFKDYNQGYCQKCGNDIDTHQEETKKRIIAYERVRDNLIKNL